MAVPDTLTPGEPLPSPSCLGPAFPQEGPQALLSGAAAQNAPTGGLSHYTASGAQTIRFAANAGDKQQPRAVARCLWCMSRTWSRARTPGSAGASPSPVCRAKLCLEPPLETLPQSARMIRASALALCCYAVADGCEYRRLLHKSLGTLTPPRWPARLVPTQKISKVFTASIDLPCPCSRGHPKHGFRLIVPSDSNCHSVPAVDRCVNDARPSTLCPRFGSESPGDVCQLPH